MFEGAQKRFGDLILTSPPPPLASPMTIVIFNKMCVLYKLHNNNYYYFYIRYMINQISIKELMVIKKIGAWFVKRKKIHFFTIT